MLDILFLTDFEIGHVYPTFKIAQNLTEHGYTIAYAGISDTMEIVAKNGFQTYVIFEDIYPAGISQNVTEEMQKHFLPLLNGELDDLLNYLKPKIIITSYFCLLESVILDYKYDFKQLIYRPFLPMKEQISNMDVVDVSKISANSCSDFFMNLDVNVTMNLISYLDEKGVTVKNYFDIVEPLTKLKHIVLCPKEFELEDRMIDKEVIYSGPNLRTSDFLSEMELQKYLPSDSSKKLIFVSFGSQEYLYPEKVNFFKLMFSIMNEKEFEDYHLIVATRLKFSEDQIGKNSSNVSIFEWVPQIEILSKISLAIIHGGLGTVKECIMQGVPMLVIPMARDQFDNARRVEKHNLGISLQNDQLTFEIVKEKIMNLLVNDNIQEGVNNMKNIFHKREEESSEVKYIEEILQHSF